MIGVFFDLKLKGCKMAKTIYDITKQNIANAMGVSDYSDLVTTDDDTMESLIKAAQKKIRFKSFYVPKMYSAGNPYIMLGRKVNNEGKYII